MKAKRFMEEYFPREWKSVIYHIDSTGSEFGQEVERWAPCWSPIPRTNKGEVSSSLLFRCHDLLHNLFPLAHPKAGEREYITVQIAGEIMVLFLTLFRLAPALKIDREETKFANQDPGLERVCDLLTGKRKAKNPAEKSFARKYVPMLQWDCAVSKVCWDELAETAWEPARQLCCWDGAIPGTVTGMVWEMHDRWLRIQAGEAGAVDMNLREERAAIRAQNPLPKRWVTTQQDYRDFCRREGRPERPYPSLTVHF